MPTPTNSVIKRADEQEEYFANLVVENETLRMEVESLTAKLNSSGVLQLHEVREENERLAIEVSQLRMQLEEKEEQLGQLKTSSSQFTNIDATLKQMLEQIQNQRKELSDMKFLVKEKDEFIQQLKTKVTTLRQGEAEQQSLLQKVQELESIVAEKTAAHGALVANQKALQAQLSEKNTELLQLKEEAAEQSKVRHQQLQQDETVASLTKELETLRAAEVKGQQKLMEKEETIQALQNEVRQLTEQLQRQRESQEKVVRAAEEQAQSSVDDGAALEQQEPVKALIEKKVQKACADRDRRLDKLVQENALLLSRMALVQQESEDLIKKSNLKATGGSAPLPADTAAAEKAIQTLHERVDYKSKRQAARSTMQKRVADFLLKTSSPTSSQAGGAAKMIDLKELEVLLQDMLDYQEDIEQEAGTQLLIREMRFEDESRKLIQRAERAEHENKEMVKAMSKQALQKVQASKSPTASPPREGPPPVQETLHPRQHHDPTVAPSHVESAIPPPQYWRQPESQPTVTAGAANVTSPPHNADNRHVKVACPACTFEQNYGNVKCEICGTTLVFMTS